MNLQEKHKEYIGNLELNLLHLYGMSANVYIGNTTVNSKLLLLKGSDLW